MPQHVVAVDDPATHQCEEDAGVSVSTRDGARGRGDGTLKPDEGDRGNNGAGPRIGSGSGRGVGTDAGVSASGSLGRDDRPRARQSVTEFIDAYASSVGSLASRLDELLHSMRDVPSDELDALVRRESRLFEEFVDEWREEFKRAL